MTAGFCDFEWRKYPTWFTGAVQDAPAFVMGQDETSSNHGLAWILFLTLAEFSFLGGHVDARIRLVGPVDVAGVWNEEEKVARDRGVPLAIGQTGRKVRPKIGPDRIKRNY